MAINKHLSHDEGLSHPHEGIVHSLVSMRVIFTKNIADHSSTFPEGLVVGQLQVIHGKEYPAMDWLEPIARVRKGPPHDHGHRILHGLMLSHSLSATFAIVRKLISWRLR